MWTLEELELSYNQILTDRQYSSNHDVDCLALNLNGLVPPLHDDEADVILWESDTVARYLTAQYGQRRLWVDAPAARTVDEKWMNWADQTLNPAHRVILFGLVRAPTDQRDVAAIETGKQVYDNPFAILDSTLTDQPRFSGTGFDTTDIVIAPFIYNLFDVGLSWTPRPHLERWC